MPHTNDHSDAKSMRAAVRELRRAVPIAERATGSRQISRSILDLGIVQSGKNIAAFLAFDGEADPLELMMRAYELQRRVFVPVIIGKGQPLMFSPWHPNVAMRPNRFGIEEPDVPKEQWVAPQELDIVITPLVAFDKNCHRLGVGGGFYDRSFAFLNSPGPDGRSPKMIGFAFEVQRVERIVRQSWDVPLDVVVTERNIYHRSKFD